MEEKCQYLSITIPVTDSETDRAKLKLPVMVYFHGGGFVTGASDSVLHDPSRLVVENDCIVINVGSRLGLFGYLGGCDENDKPANLGLLDALEALRWIQRNISAFGGNSGDPESITLFGQSAGGSTIVDLMATKEAKLLFGRAIIQSAPLGITRGRNQMNDALLDAHVKNKLTVSSSVKEVISLTQDVEATGRRWGIMGGMAFAPQYGFFPLPPENDLDMVLDEVSSHIDILIGSTANEASMFISMMPWLHSASKLPLIGPFIHSAFVSFTSQKLYSTGARKFAERHSRAGGKSSLYTITWSPSKDSRIGAMHAIELPLLFGSEEVWKGSRALDGMSWQQIEEDGKNLRRIWADFAKGKKVDADDSVKGVIDIFCVGN